VCVRPASSQAPAPSQTTEPNEAAVPPPAKTPAQPIEPAPTVTPSLKDPVLLMQEEASDFMEIRDKRFPSQPELFTSEDILLDEQWNRWRESVADAICEQLNALPETSKVKSRKLLVVRTTFVVTSEGHITAVTIDTKSHNEHLNAFVEEAIRSLDGKTDLLRFPSKSIRKLFLCGTTFSAVNGVFIHDAKARGYGDWPDAMLWPSEQ
jgi:hypothetical protein